MKITFDPDEPLAQQIREMTERGGDVVVQFFIVEKSDWTKVVDLRLHSWTLQGLNPMILETEWFEPKADLLPWPIQEEMIQ